MSEPATTPETPKSTNRTGIVSALGGTAGAVVFGGAIYFLVTGKHISEEQRQAWEVVAFGLAGLATFCGNLGSQLAKTSANKRVASLASAVVSFIAARHGEDDAEAVKRLVRGKDGNQ